MPAWVRQASRAPEAPAPAMFSRSTSSDLASGQGGAHCFVKKGGNGARQKRFTAGRLVAAAAEVAAVSQPVDGHHRGGAAAWRTAGRKGAGTALWRRPGRGARGAGAAGAG